MKLIPLPAWTDNYFWLLHDKGHALVVDPGLAQPVLDALQAYQLALDAILVTHHHADHIGGIAQLRELTGARVYGPRCEKIPEPYLGMVDGESHTILNQAVEIIETPGHTAGHIAYYLPTNVDLNHPILFCGDTLFSAGCGRIFEGTPEQMLNSLKKITTLPTNTQICSAHEYTLNNLKFAIEVERDNPELLNYKVHCQQLREQGKPTLPSRLAVELQINPFLRCRVPTVISRVQQEYANVASDELSIFTALRQWKNEYQ